MCKETCLQTSTCSFFCDVICIPLPTAGGGGGTVMLESLGTAGASTDWIPNSDGTEPIAFGNQMLASCTVIRKIS